MEKRIKELGLEIYQPSVENDLLLLHWWDHMQKSGDSKRVFTRSLDLLSNFFSNFKPPTILTFNRDEDNKIWLAVWFVPFTADTEGALFMNYWCRKDMRGASKHYDCARLIYDMATEYSQVVIGVTRHEALLRIHRKIGYNIVGKIPNLLDGEDAWVVYLTRENWLASKFRNSPASKEK